MLFEMMFNSLKKNVVGIHFNQVSLKKRYLQESATGSYTNKLSGSMTLYVRNFA